MKKLKKLTSLALATTLLTSNVYASELDDNELSNFNTSVENATQVTSGEQFLSNNNEIESSQNDLITIVDQDGVEYTVINQQPKYVEPETNNFKQARGISDNRVYTSGTANITSPDDNGNIPNLSTYVTFNANNTIATGKTVRVYNDTGYDTNFAINLSIPVQIPSVNGGYTEGWSLGNYNNFVTTAIKAGQYADMTLPTVNLTGITTKEGQQIKFINTEKTYISMGGWLHNNTNYPGVSESYKKITCQTGNIVRVEYNWIPKNTISIEMRNVVTTDGRAGDYNSKPTEGSYKLYNSTTKTTYTIEAPQNTFYNLPAGDYTLTYIKGPNNSIWTNEITPNAIPITYNFHYDGEFYHFYNATTNNQYTNLAAQLFYDFNRDGIKQSNEPLINDTTESKNISVEPFTQGGYSDAMFYDKANLKVYKAGQVYASYTGSKYQVTPTVAGVTITPVNIGKAETVLIPAPVYVYCNVSGKLYYDTDRNETYASAYDKYANGTLVIKHTLDGVAKTETITVTNGSYSIAKIESGTYDYTFTPSDNANVVSTTGKITIAPTNTPNAQGIATCTVDIPLNVQNQITIQGYYDNNFNDTYDSGDTLIDNTATVHNDKLNMFTTTSKVINVWNAGTYTVKSLNDMQPKDVYYNKDISFDITPVELQSGNAETVYVGYRPPAEITGNVVNQWGTPIEKTTVTYNGYTVTTESNGDFTLDVPYSDGSKELVATQNNYSNIVKVLALNPKNNLGTLVQNKNFYTVTGTAKDVNGNVIPNATVTIEGVSTKTNSNGVYTLDIPYAE